MNLGNWTLVLGLTVMSFALTTGPAASQGRFLDRIFAHADDESEDWRTMDPLIGDSITIYGQVSQAYLGYNDGVSKRSYFPVDNANASTRVGIIWDLLPIGPFRALTRIEAGITPRSSSQVSQIDNTGSGFSVSRSNLRKLELILDNSGIGTISIGQGSMATDGISEIDYSLTDVAAFSDPSPTAGGQFIRRSDNTLSALQISDVFDNFDGDRAKGLDSDGNRLLRVRFDRQIDPRLKMSFAIGKDVINDTLDTYADGALRYTLTNNQMKFSGGVGLTFKGSERVLAASASVYHKETGGTLTVAAGNSNESGRYGYIKIGKIWNRFDFGSTAVTLDFYRGRGLTGATSVSESIGLAAVQHVDLNNSDVFVVLRRYEYGDRLNMYKPSVALFAGARWKF